MYLFSTQITTYGYKIVSIASIFSPVVKKMYTLNSF